MLVSVFLSPFSQNIQKHFGPRQFCLLCILASIEDTTTSALCALRALREGNLGKKRKSKDVQEMMKKKRGLTWRHNFYCLAYTGQCYYFSCMCITFGYNSKHQNCRTVELTGKPKRFMR